MRDMKNWRRARNRKEIWELLMKSRGLTRSFGWYGVLRELSDQIKRGSRRKVLKTITCIFKEFEEEFGLEESLRILATLHSAVESARRICDLCAMNEATNERRDGGDVYRYCGECKDYLENKHLACEICGFFAGVKPKKLSSTLVNEHKGYAYICPEIILRVCDDCYCWYTRLEKGKDEEKGTAK